MIPAYIIVFIVMQTETGVKITDKIFPDIFNCFGILLCFNLFPDENKNNF